MSNLEKQIKEQVGAVVLLKAKLKDRILSIPDNPEITRLEGGAFTISSSEIFKNKSKNPTNIMSPDYFDFKAQYNFLCEIIDKSRLESLFTNLEQIVKTGTIKREIYSGTTWSTKSGYTYKFHPDVLKALEIILSEEL